MTGTRSMEVRRAGAALGAAALLGLVAGCGTPDVIEGGAHEPVAHIDVVDARTEVSQRRNGDAFVVGPLRTPDVPGRIIYDPPTSLARVAAADTLVRRENTGLTGPEEQGGAARDTSGAARGRSGAARDTSRRR